MKNIYLSRLQNAEHLAFMTDIVTLLEEVDIDVLAEPKTQLSVSVTNEELAQKEILKSEHTQELAELDTKRDNFYRGLTYRIKAERYSKLEANRKSTEKIMIVLNTYGTVTSSNYQKETTEVQNIIADLKSATYAQDVTRTGLTEWINWWEEANNEFNQTYISRRDAYASRPDYNLKSIRQESDTLFKKIQQIVDALQVLQPSEQLNIFVTKANTSIDKWKETLALRKNR